MRPRRRMDSRTQIGERGARRRNPARLRLHHRGRPQRAAIQHGFPVEPGLAVGSRRESLPSRAVRQCRWQDPAVAISALSASPLHRDGAVRLSTLWRGEADLGADQYRAWCRVARAARTDLSSGALANSDSRRGVFHLDALPQRARQWADLAALSLRGAGLVGLAGQAQDRGGRRAEPAAGEILLRPAHRLLAVGDGAAAIAGGEPSVPCGRLAGFFLDLPREPARHARPADESRRALCRKPRRRRHHDPVKVLWP